MQASDDWVASADNPLVSLDVLRTPLLPEILTRPGPWSARARARALEAAADALRRRLVDHVGRLVATTVPPATQSRKAEIKSLEILAARCRQKGDEKTLRGRTPFILRRLERFLWNVHLHRLHHLRWLAAFPEAYVDGLSLREDEGPPPRRGE